MGLPSNGDRLSISLSVPELLNGIMGPDRAVRTQSLPVNHREARSAFSIALNLIPANMHQRARSNSDAP